MNNTIVSLITAPINAAVAVIRLSGDNSLEIAQNIFSRKIEKPNYAYVGKLINNNEIIDEVVLIYYKAPRSFTGEDVIEISVHGSMLIANEVISLIISKGARLAQRGEFSSRAYYNNKIDLIQAEAIMSMVEATSIEAKKLALYSLEGDTSKLIKPLIDKLADILSNIEVNIDYPEYEDAEDITLKRLKEKLLPIKSKLEELLKNSNDAKIIKDGINICMIGRPNVGKSSLLNAFLEEDKAIVTDIAGTTRDIVEGETIINGIKINFLDTAGIRETANVVEKIGVDKSKKIINTADLIILVLNNNEKLTPDDLELLDLIKDKNYIIFVNKNDLPANIDLPIGKYTNVVYGNTLTTAGIKELKEMITTIFNLEKINTNDPTYITNARHKALIEVALNYLNSALENIDNGYSVDMLEIDIRACWDTLGEIIGATYKDELLDELFSNFCLGK